MPPGTKFSVRKGVRAALLDQGRLSRRLPQQAERTAPPLTSLKTTSGGSQTRGMPAACQKLAYVDVVRIKPDPPPETSEKTVLCPEPSLTCAAQSPSPIGAREAGTEPPAVQSTLSNAPYNISRLKAKTQLHHGKYIQPPNLDSTKTPNTPRS